MITYILQRKLVDHSNTIGTLTLESTNQQFWTCEDLQRPHKIKGITAIPVGTYRLKANQSARFGRTMPILIAVPDFEGVRIHWGNTAEDTEGCILVGMEYKKGYGIINSRIAFKKFFEMFMDDLAKDDVQISILGFNS